MRSSPQTLPQTLYTMRRFADVGVAQVCCPRIHDGHAAALSAHLREAVYVLRGRMVLDMTGVSRFTCAWINAMIDLSRRCDSMGGRLVVAGLRPEHLRMLRSFNLARHFATARDQHAALEVHGVRTLAPWRLAIARLLEIPVAIFLPAKAKAGAPRIAMAA